MSLWREVRRGLAVLFARGAADRDLTDELDHYLEQATADYRAQGLSPDEAARAARLDLGSPAAARQEVRAAGWEHLIEMTLGDVRVGVRRLAAKPGFTTVAVVTLALGIGAATSVFSVVDGVLLHPLPYPAAGRIVRLGQRDLAMPGTGGNTSIDDYRDWAAAARSFSALGVLTNSQPTLTGVGDPERVGVAQVSAGLFDVFSVQPILGRSLTVTDNAVGSPPVAVLRYDFWKGRLGGDPAIVGATITLDQVPVRVIGVMPQAFTGPDRLDRPIWENFTAWGDGRANHSEGVWGLLKRGVTVAQAQSEMEEIGKRLAATFPEDKGTTVSVEPLRERLVGDLERPLLVLLGSSFFLLLIACANLANLLLAGGLARASEMAVRTALGAGRVRIVRQLVTESAVLVAIGAGAGLLVARGVIQALLALGPSEVRAHPPALNPAVLGLAAGLAGLTTLLISLVPAFRASAQEPQVVLREGGSRSGAGRGRGTRRALAITQLALAVVLLSVGGLVFQSYRRVLRVLPGIRPDHLLTVNVSLPGTPRYDGLAAASFFDQVMRRIGQMPAVQSVAATSLLPFSGDEMLFGVTRIQGEPERTGSDMLLADRYAVSPSYLRTVGLRLIRGRFLADDDQFTTSPVCVVDEDFARRAFGSDDPVGRGIQLTGRPEYARVVGVVGHVQTYGLDVVSQGQIYVSLAQYPWRWSSLIIRATGDPFDQAASVKRAVHELDVDQPVTDIATMDGLMAGLLRDRQFALALLSGFAGLATILAGVGLYGVLAFGVTQRRREFSVRLALGAGPWGIARLVLAESGAIAVAGTVLGVAGALAATRLAASMLFEVGPRDTSVIGTVVALLLGVSLIAGFVPARRAMRDNAAEVLRGE